MKLHTLLEQKVVSVNRRHTRVDELEHSSDNPEAIDQSRRHTTRLPTLAEEFKVHHYAVIEDEGERFR